MGLRRVTKAFLLFLNFQLIMFTDGLTRPSDKSDAPEPQKERLTTELSAHILSNLFYRSAVDVILIDPYGKRHKALYVAGPTAFVIQSCDDPDDKRVVECTDPISFARYSVLFETAARLKECSVTDRRIQDLISKVRGRLETDRLQFLYGDY